MKFRSRKASSLRPRPASRQVIELREAELSLPNHSLTYRESNRTFTYPWQPSGRQSDSDAIELESDSDKL
jgi:hypothetical protein